MEPVVAEPLPAAIVALLLMLDEAEAEQARRSHNLPHWTSNRESEKSSPID